MDTKTPILFTSLSKDELGELMEASVRRATCNDEPTRGTGADRLLDTRQAAALLCYRPATLYGLVRAKLIPHVKARGKLLFSQKALLAWIAAGPGATPDLSQTKYNKEDKR